MTGDTLRRSWRIVLRPDSLVFATDAYVAAPPTLDHDFLRRVMDRLELGTINGEQTAIGSGLATAVNRLRGQLEIQNRDPDDRRSEQRRQDSPLTAAEAAAALGVKV